MSEEINEFISEKERMLIVEDLMEHIESIKDKMPLVDKILDYCNKYDLEYELVGDAISDNYYFKQFIELDCKRNKIIQDPKLIGAKEIGEW